MHSVPCTNNFTSPVMVMQSNTTDWCLVVAIAPHTAKGCQDVLAHLRQLVAQLYAQCLSDQDLWPHPVELQCPVSSRSTFRQWPLDCSSPNKEKSKGARGPVISDPQPMLRQLSLRERLAPGSTDAPEKPKRQYKRQYKPRGACGTFSGQRPPEGVHLKAAFA